VTYLLGELAAGLVGLLIIGAPVALVVGLCYLLGHILGRWGR
jgi:hypothetical protein